jgi:DNA repair protein RAD16
MPRRSPAKGKLQEDDAASSDSGDSDDDFAPAASQGSASSASAVPVSQDGDHGLAKLKKTPAKPAATSPRKTGAGKRSRFQTGSPKVASSSKQAEEAAIDEEDGVEGFDLPDDVDDLGGERIIAAADAPDDLLLPLMPFQREGLSWMCRQEQTVYRGGILADEMVSDRCQWRRICSLVCPLSCQQSPWP